MQYDKQQIKQSFYQDVHLETVESEFSEELHVVLSKGTLQLNSPYSIYSYGEKYSNFREAFEHIGIKKYVGKDILTLGFGLGSIPVLIEKHFGVMARHVGVEIDPAVIFLAHKYTLGTLESTIEIQLADAALYVQATDQKFDLICSDIYLGTDVPKQFESKSYLEHCAMLLQDENSLLIVNRLYELARDKRSTDQYFESVFKKVFPKGKALRTEFNLVLLSS